MNAHSKQFVQLKHRMRSPLVLWVCFILVHLVLGLLCFYLGGMGDVVWVYKRWLSNAVAGNDIVGITNTWVYPILAWVPIALSLAFGFAHYAVTWLLLMTVTNAVGFAVLIKHHSKYSVVAAWWWLASLVLLGPIALGRIDAFTVPFGIIGLLWLERRPKLSAAILTVATWIKVWPVALMVPAIITLKKRAEFIWGVVVTSSIVLILTAMAGGVGHLLGFLSSQTTRGLQVEAPVSTFWLWAIMFHTPGYHIYHQKLLNTFQVYGPGTILVSAVMNILLVVIVGLIMIIGIKAVRLHSNTARIVPLLALALVTALIAFNKVGSPQYVCWMVAPVVAGLVVSGRDFRTPALYVLGIAGFTQLVYPYLYDSLLAGNPLIILVLTARNVLYLLLLGWLLKELIKYSGRSSAKIHPLKNS